MKAARTTGGGPGQWNNSGKLVHVITNTSAKKIDKRGCWDPAACGVHPGRITTGWRLDPGATITCKQCLHKLKRQEGLKVCTGPT